MRILPKDVCTHTHDAQRRTHRVAIFFSNRTRRAASRVLDWAAPDVRGYTLPWASRPCHVKNKARYEGLIERGHLRVVSRVGAPRRAALRLRDGNPNDYARKANSP